MSQPFFVFFAGKIKTLEATSSKIAKKLACYFLETFKTFIFLKQKYFSSTFSQSPAPNIFVERFLPYQLKFL
jgi:hypothetical protein